MKTKMKTHHALCGLISGLLSRTLFTPLLVVAALFAAPAAVHAGLMYVSSGSQSVVQVSAGGVVSPFATVSANSTPWGIAVASSGNVFVTEPSTGLIREITPGGAVSTFATLGGGSNPLGMTIDGSGNLYVAHNGSPTNRTIDKITIGGTISTYATMASSFNPYNVAFDSSGNLYAGGNNNGTNNQIVKISPTQVVSDFKSSLAGAPNGLALDASGNLYTTFGTNTITKITPGGVVSTFATLPGGSAALGLAFDSLGFLYSANQSANTISKISADGLTVTTFASAITNPRYIAFAPVAVPEPGTALFGIACVGVSAFRRRRRA